MQSQTNASFHKRDIDTYLQTFKRFPITLADGNGARVRDVEGKEYIDMLAGIAVNNLGHCHPRVVRAVQEQAATLMHISNFYTSEPQVRLAERLTSLSGMKRIFFSNSGAESVEGAIKVARKYAHKNGRGGTIISFEGSFHGRTLATIATGKEAMQKGFEPIPTGFKKIPHGDMDEVRRACDQETAAIIIEPVQGEGGIRVADKAFLQDLRKHCDEHNIVLIFDEIQCGIARTGKLFAKDNYDIQPDVMTLAKGLGSGVPIGAFLSNEKVGDAIDFGDHGTTFGGNPLVCAAGLATLEVIEEENLTEAAVQKGQWIREQFAALNHPDIKDIRGLGLMIGIEFAWETKPLVTLMLEHGLLANATAGNVLRLVPPLTITEADLHQAMAIMKKTIESYTTSHA